MNLDNSPATRSNLLAVLLRSPAAIGVAHQGSERLLDEALTPDGRTLAVRGDDGNVVFFDARTLRRIGRPLETGDQVAHYGAVQGSLHGLAFSGDGKTLAVGSSNSDSATVELFDAQTHAPLGPYAISPDTSVAADVAFAPDGRSFATGELVNGTMHPPPAVVVSWDARTADARARSGQIAGRPAGRLHPGRSFPAGGLEQEVVALERAHTAAHSDLSRGRSSRAFAGQRQGRVRSGRRYRHPPRARLGQHEAALTGQSSASIEALSFSRDGNILASGAADGSIGLWSVRTGALRKTLHGHSASVRAAVFSPTTNALQRRLRRHCHRLGPEWLAAAGTAAPVRRSRHAFGPWVSCKPGWLRLRCLARGESRHPLALRRPFAERSRASRPHRCA